MCNLHILYRGELDSPHLLCKKNQITSKGVPSSERGGLENTQEMMCTARTKVPEVCVTSIVNSMQYPLLSIDVALSLPNIMFNGSRDRYRHGRLASRCSHVAI